MDKPYPTINPILDKDRKPVAYIPLNLNNFPSGTSVIREEVITYLEARGIELSLMSTLPSVYITRNGICFVLQGPGL